MTIRDFRFNNLPQSVQIIAFTILILCMAVAFYAYWLKDRIQEHAGIQADIHKLELSVAQATAIETKLQRFKQELADLEQRLAKQRSILPAEKETPDILRAVQQMATTSDLKINQFSPQPLVPRSFYSEWPIQIEVEGNYNGLGLFFEKIGRAARIIDVTTVSIKGIEQQKDPLETLIADCTATTYVFMEDQTAAPIDAKPTKEKKR